MSLKRKSSFTGLPATASVPTPNEWNIALDGGSTHLHSRTRKRFRDDRPSENVIYQNTLRWIYSAQKQRPTEAVEMDTMDSEPTTEPEAADPRQRTLHQFFKSPQQPSSFRPSPQALAPRANETAQGREENMRYQAFNQTNGTGSSSASESNSPGYIQTGGDVDMDMDTDGGSGSDGSNLTSKNWGETAWV